MHIDFGFFFASAPRGAFETAPFKMTDDYVQCLGGTRSSLFRRFRRLFVKGFLAARKHREQIFSMVQMMYAGNAALACFGGKDVDAICGELRERMVPGLSTGGVINHCHALIHVANGSFTTRCYDRYQYCCTGVH